MRTHCFSNRRLLFLCALLAAAASAQQPAIPATRDFVLHVELSARTLPPGSPLMAGVQMRNVSNHEVEIADDDRAQGFHGFKVEVTTLDGQPVRSSHGVLPPTHPANDEALCVRCAVVTLLPGEEQGTVIDITRWFDLTQPGNYVLRVMHEKLAPSRSYFRLSKALSRMRGRLLFPTRSAMPLRRSTPA